MPRLPKRVRHQGRAYSMFPDKGNNQARLYQSARSGSHPEPPAKPAPDVVTGIYELKCRACGHHYGRQRQLHPQPQVPQVPGRPARPFPVASLSQLHRSPLRSTGFKFGRERRQDSHRGQKRAHVVHETDARRIGQFSKQRRADFPA